jgi:hypothetical protein
MGSIEGYVTVFESSDGGTGDPLKTFWQFFVHVLGGGTQQVTTENARLAETMRLAVETTSKVRVTYDDATAAKVMSQARVVFEYVCESVKIEGCGPVPEPMTICMTKRYTKCQPNA